MAKLKVYSVYDSKMEAYMQPFFTHTKGAALRMWADTVADPKTQFSRHPADFTLFEIGDYDDSNGRLSSHEAKINLGTALEHKPKTAETIPMFDREGAQR